MDAADIDRTDPSSEPAADEVVRFLVGLLVLPVIVIPLGLFAVWLTQDVHDQTWHLLLAVGLTGLGTIAALRLLRRARRT